MLFQCSDHVLQTRSIPNRVGHVGTVEVRAERYMIDANAPGNVVNVGRDLRNGYIMVNAGLRVGVERLEVDPDHPAGVRDGVDLLVSEVAR